MLLSTESWVPTFAVLGKIPSLVCILACELWDMSDGLRHTMVIVRWANSHRSCLLVRWCDVTPSAEKHQRGRRTNLE